MHCQPLLIIIIRAKVGAAWGKWKEIASLLVNRGIPLHHCGKVYEAYIRSVMLYGGETWALIARLECILLSCDRRMLRYMAGVTWRDRVRSTEVAMRCGVREFGDVLRVRRLGWFGHVVRRKETEILGKTGKELERKYAGRTCKSKLAGGAGAK